MTKRSGSDGEETKKRDILDVRKLQCAQSVMALLRQLVHTRPGGYIDVLWEEQNAHRDMMTVVKRQGHAVKDETEKDGYQVLTVIKKLD